MPRFRCSSSFLSENTRICQHSARVWLVMVANAAPRIPQRNHQTNKMTSTMLQATVKSVAYMA